MPGRWSRAGRAAARPASAAPTTAGEPVLTLYSTSWCGYCSRLRRKLDRAGVTYREIDIERDSAAAALVMALNSGNRTVPTVVVADGTALTHPRAKDLLARLAS